MGTNDGDNYARPKHSEEVAPFNVSKNLISVRQYWEFIRKTNYTAPGNWINNQPFKDQLESPIVNVSWQNASAYCSWLSIETGKHFRLISEKEWEFLAHDQSHYGVSDQLTGYVEWTSTLFYLYPHSPAEPLDVSGRLYMFRGNSNSSDAEGQDPKVFRAWQHPYYIYPNLSFRVASD